MNNDVFNLKPKRVSDPSADRIERCANALAAYNDEFDEESNLTDLLADAMHWCQGRRRTFHTMLRIAGEHFEIERLEQEDAHVLAR